MTNEEEIMLQQIEQALELIEPWQKDVILYDINNNYDERNSLLYKNVGIDSQLEINRYLKRLKEKVRELVETGKYVEKHKGNSKPTLKGF